MLTSPANPLLKDVRRAIARGGLTEQGYLVAETFHLLEEALRSDMRNQDGPDSRIGPLGAVRDHVRAGFPESGWPWSRTPCFAKLADTESSQGVITLAAPPVWKLEQTMRGQSLVVVLDGLQDPGNAGAIVRAAEAFGATGVLFTQGYGEPVQS